MHIMPIHHHWLIEDRVLYLYIHGYISLEDTQDTDRRVMHHLERLPHQLHLVQNIRDTERIHFNWRMMTDSLRTFRHANLGYIINVQDRRNAFIRVASEFFNRAMGIHTHDVETLAEAITFLQTNIPDLPLHRITMPEDLVPEDTNPIG